MGSVAKVTVKRSSGPARSTTSIGRNVALIVAVLLMLIGGTLAAVKITTDYLLYQSATSDARSWAGFMAKSIADLEPIAAGELPSAASMSFFQWAQKSDQVFRYEIFNREGYSQLTADHNKIALLTLSEYSAAAAQRRQDGAAGGRGQGRQFARPAVVLRPRLCPGPGRSGPDRGRRGLRGSDAGARPGPPRVPARGGVALPAVGTVVRGSGHRALPPHQGEAARRPAHPLSGAS